MKKLLLLIIVLSLFLLSACKPPHEVYDIQENQHPEIHCVDDIEIFPGMEIVNECTPYANDFEDGDITDKLTVTGVSDIDFNVPGEYIVTYSVSDSDGAVTWKYQKVTVKDVEITYPTGFYKYWNVDFETRLRFMAAAEKYLLNNMAGGIPVFSSSTFQLFSDRVVLPTDQYIPLLEYGEDFAELNNDDSNVLMYDGNYGSHDEFSKRKRFASKM